MALPPVAAGWEGAVPAGPVVDIIDAGRHAALNRLCSPSAAAGAAAADTSSPQSVRRRAPPQSG